LGYFTILICQKKKRKRQMVQEKKRKEKKSKEKLTKNLTNQCLKIFAVLLPVREDIFSWLGRGGENSVVQSPQVAQLHHSRDPIIVESD